MPDRKGSEFAGLSVAIITPFADGEVDYARLREQIEFQIDAGTSCIVPVGTTGESPTLSHAEHEKVIAEVIQCVAGRAKVMAGTGSNSTAEALRLTTRAAAEGADATLQVAPYYNKPTQEGFYQHFKAVAESVDIPVCVYNIPGRTGKEIDVSTIQRLADVPGITMVKEATGKLDQCSAIIGTTNLTVLSGDDSLTLPMMSVGAEGVISVVANLAMPLFFLSFLRHHRFIRQRLLRFATVVALVASLASFTLAVASLVAAVRGIRAPDWPFVLSSPRLLQANLLFLVGSLLLFLVAFARSDVGNARLRKAAAVGAIGAAVSTIMVVIWVFYLRFPDLLDWYPAISRGLASRLTGLAAAGALIWFLETFATTYDDGDDLVDHD